MDPAQPQKTSLENLDIFTLLGLGHLSDEEKANYLTKIGELAMGEFLANYVSDVLSPEDQDEFLKITEAGDSEASMGFLREKVADFDNLFRENVLSAKKKLVRASVEERMKVSQDDAQKMTLEKTLAAIDADDWATASSLIASN